MCNVYPEECAALYGKDRVGNFQRKVSCSRVDGVELFEEHPGLLAPERKYCNEKGEAVLFF